MTSEVSRRGIIIGLGASLVAAPAIVRASSLMKVKPGNRETTEMTARWLAEIEASTLTQAMQATIREMNRIYFMGKPSPDLIEIPSEYNDIVDYMLATA